MTPCFGHITIVCSKTTGKFDCVKVN